LDFKEMPGAHCSTARSIPEDANPGTLIHVGMRRFWRCPILVLPMLFALMSAACGRHDDVAKPLDPAEMQAVVGEIGAMVKTSEDAVESFVVREATPERIDRLYGMPELVKLPLNIRENGLIFAGQGVTLSFDKPSDVLAKLSAWFPAEIAAAQVSARGFGSSHPHLYGPFPNWRLEPTAFMALWECMPQVAWERPRDNPFRRRWDNDLGFMAIAARSSNELDFGACVRERSGERPVFDAARLETQRRETAAIGAKATPVLQEKFHRFLAAQACGGQGPDDCVLVLWMWASLAPGDGRLAEAIRALEPVVAPNGEPSPLQKPADQYGPGPQDGEARFDEILRKAAFLRAKLLSVTAAPGNWPPEALSATLHQLTKLQEWYAANVDHRRYLYELDYRNEAVNPWNLVGRVPAEALLRELEALTPTTDCKVHEQWFKHGGPDLASRYSLHRLNVEGGLRCATPDWAWLTQATDPAAQALRDEYVGMLGGLDSGVARDMVLSGLMATSGCSDKGRPAWLASVCSVWVSRPQIISAGARRSLLKAAVVKAYRRAPLAPLPEQREASAPMPWRRRPPGCCTLPTRGQTMRARAWRRSPDAWKGKARRLWRRRNGSIHLASRP
jgi:hypothetical protein